ncbi:uncharacterized protein K02A2.6-like [Portunus trituberculatus]|uniref:uncharacterized protein K02A2.6-like n=1 Tax=Portunus trituberculatus TaxID=210409 RepID=UPI001E1CBE48|nr:uncharacterized protein K02A2.6-like [Portunus trituberculatus]
MLRDRLVCGIDDRKIQARLLADGNLDFKKAEATALAMEAAARDTQDLQLAGEQRGNHVWGSTYGSRLSFSRSTCYVCKKVGHLARVCRSKSNKNNKMHKIEHGASNDSEDCCVEEYAMYTVSKSRDPPVVVHPRLNKVMVPMEIDTGAAVSVLNKETYEESWKGKSKPVLKVSEVVLRTYSGSMLKVLGEVEVEVEYGNQLETLPLVVVDGDGPNLLGRNWLRKIKLDWGAVYNCSTDCDNVIRKFDKVFKDELGLIKSTNAVFYVDKEASPRFFKARPLPYALKEKVEFELERLLKQGVIEPVQFSEWAAPIVPIVKVDNSIRICGDYKLTVNRVCKVDSYPIPKIEDLLLQKEVKWQWGHNEQRALSLSKQLLGSSRVLVHYDSSKSLLLTCDASSHGLGAVLSHRLESGEERPIAFASRTLGSAERKKYITNADALSRLPLPEAPKDTPVPGDVVCVLERQDRTTVTAKDIRRWTERDPILSIVRRNVQYGWPENVTVEAQNPSLEGSGS